jgi:hypothetical protein
VAHLSRRRLVPALVGIVFIILAAGCSSSSSSSNNGSSSSGSNNGSAGPPVPARQVVYVRQMRQDLQSLDRGVLSHSQIGSLKTAAATQFEVTVTDLGKDPILTTASGPQQNVPTGGMVGVQIVACVNLTCNSESDLRQMVLYKGQRAQWFWSITAGTPGPAMITLRANTYDQGSTLSLSEEIFQVNVNVVPTPAFNNQQTHKKIAAATKSVVGVFETLGVMAGAIVAVGGIVGWFIMMTRKRNANPQGEQQPERADKAP